jgi:two-component system, sensor histidine kinase and response regulator
MVNPLILIVDDVPENVELISKVVSRANYKPITALSGPEAINLAREQQPDTILLDVMMPEMDGFEVCRKLQEDPITRTIPVLMLTARTEPDDFKDGMQAGAFGYLKKPVNRVELLAYLHTSVRHHHMVKKLKETNENLEHLNRNRDALTAMLVHDLKNPLSAVIGNLLLLEEDLSENKEVLPVIKNSIKASEIIQEMVQDLLDYSRLETGSYTIKFEKCNFKKVLEDAMRDLDNKKLNVNDIPNIELNIDKKLLSRILRSILVHGYENLLPDDAPIDIQTSLVNGLVNMAFVVHGPTPNEAQCKLLFKPEALLGKDRLRIIRGPALLLVDKAVTALNGKLNAYPDSIGGLKIFLELPGVV